MKNNSKITTLFLCIFFMFLSSCEKEEIAKQQENSNSKFLSVVEKETTKPYEVEVVEIEEILQFPGSDDMVKFTNCYSFLSEDFQQGKNSKIDSSQIKK